MRRLLSATIAALCVAVSPTAVAAPVPKDKPADGVADLTAVHAIIAASAKKGAWSTADAPAKIAKPVAQLVARLAKEAGVPAVELPLDDRGEPTFEDAAKIVQKKGGFVVANTGRISQSQNVVLFAAGDATVTQSKRCVVIAGGNVRISQSEGCVVIAAGTVQASQSHAGDKGSNLRDKADPEAPRWVLVGSGGIRLTQCDRTLVHLRPAAGGGIDVEPSVQGTANGNTHFVGTKSEPKETTCWNTAVVELKAPITK